MMMMMMIIIIIIRIVVFACRRLTVQGSGDAVV